MVKISFILQLTCSVCKDRKLRLCCYFPVGSTFACKNKNCPSDGGAILCTNANRYNCFHCNYDLCVNCVRYMGGPNAVAADTDPQPCPRPTTPAQAAADSVLVVSADRAVSDPPPSYYDCMKEFGDVV
jgi:hypothetical protein